MKRANRTKPASPPLGLDAFFSPKSVAVIGASREKGKVGHGILQNLLTGGVFASKTAKPFGGNVYAVNPFAQKILGVTCHASILDVPGNVDLAIVCVPAANVLKSVQECVQKGVRACVLVSAGFSESGQGELQAAVLKAAAGKMRILGPNTLGLIRPCAHLNASFGLTTPAAGKIAFLTQSGALADSVIDWALAEDYAFSAIVSVGNAADVGFPELVRHFANDSQTKSIALYVEGISNGRDFMDAVRYAGKKGKPVVVLKGGTTSAGQKAAHTHTASLASDGRVFGGAMRQAGALQVGTLTDLFGVAKSVADCHAAKKPWAVLANAGGVGVLVSDACARHQVSLATLSKATLSQLDAVLPPTWSHANPVDLIGDATSVRYQAALKILLAAPEVGGVMVAQTLQTMTDTEQNAKKIVALAQQSRRFKTPKPVLTLFLGGKFSHASMRYLNRHGVPDFNDPENLAVAARALAQSLR